MKNSTARLLVTYAVLVSLLIVVGFPLLWMVISSLKPGQELFTQPPRILPSTITFEWYRDVLFRSQAPRLFFNSLLVATTTMIINVVVATLGAYSLARFRYPGRNIFLISTLVSYVFPAVLLLVPLFLTLKFLGLVDSLIGVIVSHVIITLPLSLWLLRSFFMAIPYELEEAALIDGANYLGAFTRITLPLAAPGVLSTGLLAFIMSWNEFLFASVIGASNQNKTLPVGISEFVSSFDIRWGEIMALGTITTIPVLLFFILIQRSFVRGILAGAVKG